MTKELYAAHCAPLKAVPGQTKEDAAAVIQLKIDEMNRRIVAVTEGYEKMLPDRKRKVDDVVARYTAYIETYRDQISSLQG